MEVLDVSWSVESVLGDWGDGGCWAVDELCSRLFGGLGFLCLGGAELSFTFPACANLAPVGVRVDIAAAAFANLPRAGDSSRVPHPDPVVVTVSATAAPLIPRQPRPSAHTAGFRIRRTQRPRIAGTPPLVVPVGANPASTGTLLDRCTAASTGVHYDSLPSYGRVQSIVETRIRGGVSISALGKHPRYVLWRARRCDACSRALSNDDWVKQNPVSSLHATALIVQPCTRFVSVAWLIPRTSAASANVYKHSDPPPISRGRQLSPNAHRDHLPSCRSPKNPAEWRVLRESARQRAGRRGPRYLPARSRCRRWRRWRGRVPR